MSTRPASFPRLARRRGPVACEEARQDISAHLDGERATLPDTWLEAHLHCCRACQDFRSGAVRVGVQLAMRSSRRPPDDLAAMLASFATPAKPPVAGLTRRRPRDVPRAATSRRGALRWAVALVPLGLVGLAFPVTASAHTTVVPTRVPTPCTAHLRPTSTK